MPLPVVVPTTSSSIPSGGLDSGSLNEQQLPPLPTQHPQHALHHQQQLLPQAPLPPTMPLKHSRTRSTQRSSHSRGPSISSISDQQVSHQDPALAMAHAQAQAQAPVQQQPTPTRTVQKRRSIGDWDLIKTVGAGSMGQVKLAHNRVTDAYCAIKVVPIASAEHRRNPSISKEPTSSKKESDESKDIRTVREAAISLLLHHKYICELYEMHPMSSHYYMLFEYVSGGQMLDYIIAHGSLKEKQARKFCRMIASALDYCHHNSIVHRGEYKSLFQVDTRCYLQNTNFACLKI